MSLSCLLRLSRAKLTVVGLVGSIGLGAPTALLDAARAPQATPPAAPRQTPVSPQGGSVRRRVAATVPQPTGTPVTRELLDKYCVSCHNDRLKTAGLSLERLALDQVGPN